MNTSIRLQNFEGHRDTTVPLGRFTVLVGPNGAGKTSVLEVLALQSRFSKEDVTAIFLGDNSPLDLYRRGGEGPIIITSQGGMRSRDPHRASRSKSAERLAPRRFRSIPPPAGADRDGAAAQALARIACADGSVTARGAHFSTSTRARSASRRRASCCPMAISTAAKQVLTTSAH